MFHEVVEADALNTGHGGDFLPLVFAFTNENRPDQVIDVQAIFLNQPTCKGIVAITPRAEEGE
ncbi:hypothetical protein Gbth_001_027 [Gluconobacter thailandicus F149-1 = NBRC 100600]|nr:hypothetical protein Gbfr_022_059 [Gluconobacter frateurii M-2]GAN91804.1 hypothetical protein Gbth_001_027 [Gluconobacter thailandicus F149-1 = NBRC 100600]GBR59727.1 hypothetical protein AA100600_1458 [Gluconobacter thailandicus F149-1 = NBRC 100600]GEL86793.1 hypothetical protein GTH01_11510 [Gluconobacter thailandicus F149-1 = NBRC 100600]